MEILRILVYMALASFVLWPGVRAQSSEGSGSRISARALDALLQDYAFRAFVRPKTGVIYDGHVPMNLSGIEIAALRLRYGSMGHRGFSNYKEFDVPVGLLLEPFVVRLVLVYQNLRNWSSEYYNVPGYSLLAPVLGLLAYDAKNLSAKNLPELDGNALVKPFVIRFKDVEEASSELTPRCIRFNSNGTFQLSNLMSRNECSTRQFGHFSIVVESTAPTPAPAPAAVPALVPHPPVSPPPHNQAPASPSPFPSGSKKDRSKVWKITVPVIAGTALLVLFALILVWLLRRFKQKKNLMRMEQQAEVGEALRMTSIGSTKAPMATGTRTPPVLENEYVP